MALLTIDQFATKCGMPRRALMVYIQRTKVVVDGDIIDTTHEKNVLFYNKREAKGKINPNGGGVVATKPKIEQIPREETYVEPKGFKIKQVTEDEDDLGEEPDESGILPYNVSEKHLKHWQAKKAEKETTLLEVKEQKLRAEVIPSVLIPPLIIKNNQSFIMAFKNTTEEILTEFGKIKDFTPEEFAEMRGRLLASINAGSKSATEMTIKAVKGIVTDYSIKRGVGERG